jgi:hypothetical protein
MGRPVILFIVEGEKRDYRFVEEMKRCFLSKGRHQVSVINLPASRNIYMLYEKLREDDFETDVVELLREDVPEARAKLEGIPRRAISQVYLFFDFDPHQDNLVGGTANTFEVVAKMLQVFDNETENGKLFVSYPMVEALYDYRAGDCQAFTGCFVPLDEIGGYKRLSGEGNLNAGARMDYSHWKDAIEVFALRVRCLLELDEMSFDDYRERVTPLAIYEAQRVTCSSRASVFVLSAFPEFLLDYFKRDFWNSHVKKTRRSFETCEKKRRAG